MDVLIVILAARQEKLWPYYAFMATAGSIIGGYVTFRLARRGGVAALERKFRRETVMKVRAKYARWGWGAIAIPAFLPPPMPMVPFLFAAGAMRYPIRKFLTALALGRAARYTLLAFLAARYGRRVLGFFLHRERITLLIAMGLLAIVGIAELLLILVFRSPKRA